MAEVFKIDVLDPSSPVVCKMLEGFLAGCGWTIKELNQSAVVESLTAQCIKDNLIPRARMLH